LKHVKEISEECEISYIHDLKVFVVKLLLEDK